MEKEENQKMNIYLEKEINFFGEIKSIFHKGLSFEVICENIGHKLNNLTLALSHILPIFPFYIP